MRWFRNPSFYALGAVVAAAALVGMPKIASFSQGAEQRDQHLQQLEVELQRLNNLQEKLQISLLGDQRLLAEHGERLQQQATRLEEQRVHAASLTPQAQRARLRHDILGPVFQVSGEDAVGSAVLVHHGKDDKGSYYLALSCYHVLRDIVATDDTLDSHTVPFDSIFDPMEGDSYTLSGYMLAENIAADLALLRIDTDLDLGPIANLAPRERKQKVQAFTPIYTVGCPLGTNAQATHGEITRNDWEVDQQPYWMVSSPAYFGNSGGGVFLEESHELVGIFSKIYTHGNYRPQVITHMGLAVPLDTIHDWLEEIGYEHILTPTLIEPALQVEEASAR